MISGVSVTKEQRALSDQLRRWKTIKEREISKINSLSSELRSLEGRMRGRRFGKKRGTPSLHPP